MVVQTSNSPELLQTAVAGILVKPLEAKSQFLAAGPIVYNTAQPLHLPKLGGPITAPGWTGESELIPDGDVDFDQVNVLRSTIKSIKVLTRFSAETFRQSVISLDASNPLQRSAAAAEPRGSAVGGSPNSSKLSTCITQA